MRSNQPQLQVNSYQPNPAPSLREPTPVYSNNTAPLASANQQAFYQPQTGYSNQPVRSNLVYNNSQPTNQGYVPPNNQLLFSNSNQSSFSNNSYSPSYPTQLINQAPTLLNHQPTYQPSSYGQTSMLSTGSSLSNPTRVATNPQTGAAFVQPENGPDGTKIINGMKYREVRETKNEVNEQGQSIKRVYIRYEKAEDYAPAQNYGYSNQVAPNRN